MAGEWRTVSAEEFCSSVRDGTHDSPKPVDHGCSLVTSRHITGGQLDLANAYLISQADFDTINKRSKVDRWDVLLSMIGTVGEPCLIKEQPNFAIKNIGLFKSKGEAEGKWLYYYLRSPNAQQLIREQSRGTTQQYIPLGALREFPVLMPDDHAEMCAIAHILGTLDDKIELNRRMNETLEATARALFKSWFVDFDPVRAKAEGRDPGLPKPLADLFPDSFEDSELGEIPKGWEVKKLSDLCSTQYGYTASAVDEPVGPKLLRVTDINKRNWIEWADVPHCAIETEARASYALQVGDLVVARMADPGKSAIIEEKIEAVFASYLVRLKTASLAHSYYIYGFLKSGLYAEYAEGAKSGSVQANMNAKVIAGASIVVPPTTVMVHFLGAVLPLRQRLVANVRESRTLTGLRDTLLPKLISGELRISDAARFIKG